jgi:hypothetical protein
MKPCKVNPENKQKDALPKKEEHLHFYILNSPIHLGIENDGVIFRSGDSRSARQVLHKFRCLMSSSTLLWFRERDNSSSLRKIVLLFERWTVDTSSF